MASRARGGAARAFGAAQAAPTRRKRFYDRVAVAQAPAGWCVTLDGRRVPTPAGRPLAVPSLRLALALAAEWDAQATHVEPATMPLASLAATAVDQVATGRAAVVAGLLRYAATDTCRFFADGAAQPEVRAAQEARLAPVAAWLAAEVGADLPRAAPGGLRAPPVDAASAAALEAACDALDDWSLAALQCAVFECKSLALGLALLAGRLDPRGTSNLRPDFDARARDRFDALLGCAPRARREQSIRPKLGRIDVDVTELENFKVWSGRPEPAVDFRAGLDARGAEAAARVEETANIDRWGLVEGAHDYDLARIQVQLASASFFADAARAP